MLEAKAQLLRSPSNLATGSDTRWLWRNTISAGSEWLGFGPPASNKTMLMQGLAVHGAHGAPFLGRETRQFRTALVNGEGGDLECRNRIQAIHLHTGLDERITNENLFVISEPLDFCDPHTATVVSEAIQDVGGVDLLIVDTLAACSGGSDENAPGPMKEFWRNLRNVKRDTGAAFVVIHHPNKSNPKSPGGSNILTRNPDYVFRIELDGRSPGVRFLRNGEHIDPILKNRNGIGFGTIRFRVQEIELEEFDEYGEPITSAVVVPASGIAEPIDAGPVRRFGANQRKALEVLEAMAAEAGEGGDRQAIDMNDFADRCTQAGLCKQRLYEVRKAFLSQGIFEQDNEETIWSRTASNA